MSRITVIWSMTASACLTLALIHALIWRRRRAAWANLLFAVTAVGTAALAGGELSMMRAATPASFAAALRWAHLPVWVVVVSMAGFVRLYFRAGRPWLMWAACGVRTAALALDFLTGENLNYRRVTGLLHVRVLGDAVAVGDGVPNPWMAVGQLSLWLLVAFVIDASARVWRRGERQKAALVGGSVALLAAAGAAQSIALFYGHVHWPFMASPIYLCVVAAMGYELSRDALAAEAHKAQVAHLLRAATLGELSSALAHELNQPLAAILSNAHAAQRLLARGTASPAELADILRDIVADDERAAAVIRRLRTLLKKGEPDPRPLDIRDVVGDVLALMAGDLTARGVSVDADLEPSPVCGDPVQLQQVMINLLLNAADAMTTTDATARRLTVRSARVPGGLVRVCVADTGPGLPTGGGEKLFEPYHTTKPDGLGLGLSLSRSIVIAHGGRLWAEAAPGGGAAFCFTLPEHAADEPGCALP